ncbi:MAG TPA: patatin-like phospholipase family protein [Pyrinomonadaceae bacterium]|nr:patatin-like phospholipase family protein [Pyrinomonadaceae bacterium]
MNLKTRKHEIPLHLCQVLEEEFESLHEQPDASGSVDASVGTVGGTDAAPDWEFHEGHVDFGRLARTLEAAHEAWAARGGTPESVEDIATYLALKYPGLRAAPQQATGEGGVDRRLDILNRILREEDEAGNQNGPGAKVFRKAWFEPKALRDETRGLLEFSGHECGAAAFDDSRGARSDLRRFRRLLLEDAFPTEIKRVYDLRMDEAVRRIHELEKARSAVCFSGGGIRSGTFALGVIQALARRGLLGEFDYLSTVSGGGYVGGWLTAWIHRHPHGLEGVVRELNGSARNSMVEPEPGPLRHLRDFSNFITPRPGLLSADSWTFIVIYIRNLMLNWVVLIPLLASVLMIPRVANAVILAEPAWRVLAGLVLLGGLSLFLLKPDRRTVLSLLLLGGPSLVILWLAQSTAPGTNPERVARVEGTLLAAGALLSGYALAYMRLNRPSNVGVVRPGSYWHKHRDQNGFLWMCLLPLTVSAMLLVVFWAWFRRTAGTSKLPNVEFLGWNMSPFGGFVVYGVLLGFAGLFIYALLAALSWWGARGEVLRMTREKPRAVATGIFKNVGRELLVTLFASLLGAVLLYVVAVKIPVFFEPVVATFETYADGSTSGALRPHTEWRRAEVYTFLAFPAYLLHFFLGLTLFVGFTSRRSEKSPRERRVRAGGAGNPLGKLWWYVTHPFDRTYVEDEDREWLARASAWIFIVAGGWLLIGGLVIFGPLLYFEFGNWLAAAGGASGLLALLGGGSARTPGSKQEGMKGKLQTLGVNVLVLASFVFFACIVIAVSLLTATVIAWLAQFFTPTIAALLSISPRNLAAFAEHYPFQSRENVFRVLHFPSWLYVLVLALGLQIFGRVFAALINLNKFSLHAGYRDRIIRAFLGASRLGGERDANPFTGFDPRDNLHMEELRPMLLRESDFAEPDGLTRFVNELNRPPAERKGVAKFLRREIEAMEGDSRKYFKDPPGSVEINPSFRAALFGDLNTILQGRDIPEDGETSASSAWAEEYDASRVRRNRERLWRAYDYINYPPKPYRLMHVVNMALNLVRGDRLAWQQRRAQSFTASPLHAGTLFGGYRRTRDYGGKNGISLGTAVAISGAAASSNMGYFSPSPFVTFVLTFFNARLGWWLGNPGVHGADSYFRSHPQSALSPIVDEAFGLTDAEHPYVLLSDGGHFENLGLYEMVLRRCRTIFVVDGSADPEGSYSDLGSAVRKIRIDFGIPIEFPSPFPIIARPQSESKSGAYFAVGDIHYEAVDAPPPGRSSKSLTGKLIYIKPTIYNEEPRDIYNYAQSDPTFPHESTADQFFDEPQFESHRMLGYHILTGLLDGAASTSTGDGVTNYPKDLRTFVNWLSEKAEIEKRAAADAEQDKALTLFKAMISSVSLGEGSTSTSTPNGVSGTTTETTEQTPTPSKP